MSAAIATFKAEAEIHEFCIALGTYHLWLIDFQQVALCSPTPKTNKKISLYIYLLSFLQKRYIYTYIPGWQVTHSVKNNILMHMEDPEHHVKRPLCELHQFTYCLGSVLGDAFDLSELSAFIAHFISISQMFLTHILWNHSVNNTRNNATDTRGG